MQNSLSPAFVKIEYTSAYAPHTMTIPSVPLNNVGVDGTPPNFDLRGAAVDVNADDAVRDFIDLVKQQFLGTTVFNSYTIFSQPAVGDTPVPVWSAALNITGTNLGATQAQAVQSTFTFRATDFTIYKLVLLDAPAAHGFGRVTTFGGDTATQDLVDYITDPVTWFASRGGGRPNTFLQLATTLNEKLRRSYRMN